MPTNKRVHNQYGVHEDNYWKHGDKEKTQTNMIQNLVTYLADIHRATMHNN
jgi:hypothetical protein